MTSSDMIHLLDQVHRIPVFLVKFACLLLRVQRSSFVRYFTIEQ